MADLTIIMPSWNKEAYIAEALDSVFAQKLSFTFEIVIADDHSTDRTLDIVADYARRHPGIITVLRSDENLKLFRNVRRAYAVCKTPYFCVLDPDDYWTDERHLEKALSFLSAHPDFTIYSAGIEQLFPDGTRQPCGFPTEPVDSDFADFQRQRAAIAFTQTCVYRNVVFAKGLPDQLVRPSHPSMEKSCRGDTFRNFLHIREGKAHFEPAVEACYRITDVGVYQGLDEAGQLVLNAQIYADLWRYDAGRYVGLLTLSQELCRKAETLLAASDGRSADAAGQMRLREDVRTLRALYAKVPKTVSAARCCSCGACKVTCPKGAIRTAFVGGMFVPSVDYETCVGCGACLMDCPCGGASSARTSPQEFRPIASYSLYARDAALRWRSASGGFVTQLLTSLLRGGKYARAYVVAADSFSGEQAKLLPVESAEEIALAAKSKYVPVSTERVVADICDRKIAGSIVVCTPCQLTAIRRAMARCHVPEDSVLFVGLFCLCTMRYDVYARYREDYGPYDKLFFKDKEPTGWPGDTSLVCGGRTRKVDGRVRASFMHEYRVTACADCRDKLNAQADISVGDCYVPGYSRMDGNAGLSNVLVRTEKGRAAFEACRRDFVVEPCGYEAVRSAQSLAPLTTDAERRRKRYVLLDVYDFSNRGDWMMLEAMLEQVRGRLPRAVPVIPRFAYDQQVRWCDERGIVPLGGGRFYGLLKPRKLKKQVPPRLIDTVLFSPGFRFSDQIAAGCQADYYRSYFGQFTKRGRRIFFMPQAFGPFETPAAQACMKEVFPIADRIFVRDEESLRFLEALVGKSDRLEMCPDFTCLFHGERHPLPYPERGYVVLIPNYNMVAGTDKTTGSHYETFMIALADHLTERGEKVVLLNHEGERDERIAMRINAQLKTPAYLATRLTGGECKSVISGAKLVVSSRFHGVVSGLTDGVATLCTSWSHKYGELIRELGCSGNCLDVTDRQRALKTVDDALASPARYAPTAETLERLRHRVYEMWDEILPEGTNPK